eukprot:scaffold680_cov264-Pinguiococcus_pyrenoidosus.AAC.4
MGLDGSEGVSFRRYLASRLVICVASAEHIHTAAKVHFLRLLLRLRLCLCFCCSARASRIATSCHAATAAAAAASTRSCRGPRMDRGLALLRSPPCMLRCGTHLRRISLDLPPWQRSWRTASRCAPARCSWTPS